MFGAIAIDIQCSGVEQARIREWIEAGFELHRGQGRITHFAAHVVALAGFEKDQIPFIAVMAEQEEKVVDAVVNGVGLLNLVHGVELGQDIRIRNLQIRIFDKGPDGVAETVAVIVCRPVFAVQGGADFAAQSVQPAVDCIVVFPVRCPAVIDGVEGFADATMYGTFQVPAERQIR